MTFKLACGDVLPGCAARFEAGSREDLMEQMARHAEADHGIGEITPEIAHAVSGQVVTLD